MGEKGLEPLGHFRLLSMIQSSEHDPISALAHGRAYLNKVDCLLQLLWVP